MSYLAQVVGYNLSDLRLPGMGDLEFYLCFCLKLDSVDAYGQSK
jgi:hypothetical protein